jgi:hypothetical protein
MRAEHGQSTSEYTFILMLVVIVALVGYVVFAGGLGDLWDSVWSHLRDAFSG